MCIYSIRLCDSLLVYGLLLPPKGCGVGELLNEPAASHHRITRGVFCRFLERLRLFFFIPFPSNQSGQSVEE